jgi:hypothetical protein
MMPFIALGISVVLMQPNGGEASASTDPAVTIHAIRQFEVRRGRTQESWTALTKARAEVYDPLYARAPLPEWLDFPYRMILQWQLMALGVVLLCGSWAAYRLWKAQLLVQSLVLAGFWMMTILALWLAVAREPGTAGIVLTEGSLLRTGNGLSYPVRTHQGVPIRLTAGVEGVVRTVRSNGWMQLELPGGQLGWVPEGAVGVVLDR